MSEEVVGMPARIALWFEKWGGGKGIRFERVKSKTSSDMTRGQEITLFYLEDFITNPTSCRGKN